MSFMFNSLINAQTLKIGNQFAIIKNQNILKVHDAESMDLIYNIIGIYKSREIHERRTELVFM